MQRSLWLRRTALVAVLALTVAACSGDNGETGGTDSPEPTAPATDGTDEPTEAGTAAPRNEANGVLEIGFVLPETGPLAFLGPPMTESVRLAVQLINEAGGVLGQDVVLREGDEAGDAAVASQSASRLLGEGVDAIVGAASSGMSLAIIDAVTGAGVVQCSGSNTSPTFTNYNDNGLYFRTAPTDALQGPVLADVMINAGASNIALLARADDYGQGLLNATEGALEEQGATIALSETYDAEAANFDAEVQAVLDSGADSVAVLAFDEGAQIIKGLIEAGMTPDQIFGADGVASADLWEKVDPNNPAVLEGMRGTRPGGETSQDFLTLFAQTGVTDTTFAAQKYDCVNLIALAAIAADSDAGVDIAAAMESVSKDGEQCSDFASCKELLEAGTDIDYVGASGPADLNDTGEPSIGTYETWELDAEGALNVTGSQDATLE
jgi:ABC-type branched-subunit amino acid transport system substrate-binding protein